MTKYNIEYEILDYDKYNQRLANLMSRKTINPVTKHADIGKSSCGFPIEHYSIGNGPIHVTYMGGAHGNEIIGVDFVTQLMENLADGQGDLANVDLNEFTIDFIPCQNPDGFYTTTYALKQIMGHMTPEEVEKFSKDYWRAFRTDDQNVVKVRKVIKALIEHFGVTDIDFEKILWRNSIVTDLTAERIAKIFSLTHKVDLEECKKIASTSWQENDLADVISPKKKHLEAFDGVTLDCIPERDESHILLKKKLTAMYKDGTFPLATLANFFANGDGVNLNDNNEAFYNEFKEKVAKEGVVTGNARYNTIIKSVNGPIGVPAKDMSKPFAYASENEAILNYINSCENSCAFINVHGTGGMLYIYPVWEQADEVYTEDGEPIRDFKFTINGNLGSSYAREISRTYREEYGDDKGTTYNTTTYPNRITGLGDYLRKNYDSALLLELSKMGGNPIAPYGDRKGNYEATMTSNFNAFNVMLNEILRMQELYNSNYVIEHQPNGMVSYKTVPRRR